jgi:hypothetical protein
MVSVGVSWSGTCPANAQDELVRHLCRLADESDELLKRFPSPASEFSLFDRSFMTTERERALRSRPNVDRIDRAIPEPIEIDANIFHDYGELERGAEHMGLPITGGKGRAAADAPYVLNLVAPDTRKAVRLRKAAINGINFKLFGVGYPWYPGEDRVSFVFLHSPEFLFLDGRVVDVYHRALTPGLIRFDRVHGSDWYARVPEIHLRHYLEQWFDYFLSWVKFFFIHDLHYWRHASLPGYEYYRTEFEALQARVAAPLAARIAFDGVIASFLREAEFMHPSPDKTGAARHGMPGRVLRILRESDGEWESN